ncbi:uncharacterized protein [Anabrus simplex]|uniref:uncharacterized protein n=1 Tax=Anabrus simplex TaxID=316456 RepID=UPI0035A36B74
MRQFTYVENIVVVAVFFIVIAARNLHVEGACLDPLCATFTRTEDKIEHDSEEIGEEIREADAVLKRGVEELFLHSKNRFRENSGKCACIHYNCGCCAHIEESFIDLNSTICANASYLVKDRGFSLTVTVNHYTIYNETVSVRNPPPVCLGWPFLKSLAAACVHLYDIQRRGGHLHACVAVEARMKGIVVFKHEIGCFDLVGLPEPISNDLYDNAQKIYASVIMV